MPDVDVNEVTIELPPLPKREGEDARYGATLDNEHARRQEALRSPDGRGRLHSDIGKKVTALSRSKSARKEQILLAQYRAELEAQTYERDGRIQGPLAPATIINLNPVWLTLSGMMKQFRVPPAGFASARMGGAIKIEHRGRTFSGHYMTFREAKIWMAVTGTNTDRSIGYDTADRSPKHLTPAGIAHQFFAHHVEGSANAKHMGGIIIFEGDIHTIESKKLKATSGQVWVPRREKLAVGDGYFYRMYPESFSDFLGRMLEQQAGYASTRLTEAHSFWTTNDPMQQKQITEQDRVWARWSLEMQYIKTLPDWVTQRLDMKEVQSITRCPRCSKPQLHDSAFFCECGAPFNAFDAYMAGHNVPREYLEVLEGDELKKVRAEMKRRKSKFADIDEPPPAKPAKGAKVQEVSE